MFIPWFEFVNQILSLFKPLSWTTEHFTLISIIRIGTMSSSYLCTFSSLNVYLFLVSPRVTPMFRLFCSQLCTPKAPWIPHSLEVHWHPLFVSVFPKPQTLSCSRGFNTPNTLDVCLGFRHPILNLTLSAQTHFQLHSATTHYKSSLRVWVGLFGPVVVSWRGRASRNQSCSPPAGPLSPGK